MIHSPEESDRTKKFQAMFMDWSKPKSTQEKSKYFYGKVIKHF